MSWYVYLFITSVIAILSLHASMVLGRTNGVVIATHLDNID